LSDKELLRRSICVYG